jgi:ribosomal protein S12 methylthiotransferase
MRRGTTREKTVKLLQQIREKIPGMAIRTTLIAGHPGETEEDFQEMLDFVRESRFERLGVFTYSHEENTHSFSMEDDVPEEVKQERADEIMELQQSISLEINQGKINKSFKVLIDRKEGDNFVGRTEYDSPEVDNEVLINAKDHYLRVGDFTDIKITDATDFDLIGIPAGK